MRLNSRFKRFFTITCGCAVFLGLARIGWAVAQDPAFLLRCTAYLYTPQFFADRWLGSIPVNPHVPLGVPYEAIWYVRYEAPLNFDNLRDLLGSFPTARSRGLI